MMKIPNSTDAASRLAGVLIGALVLCSCSSTSDIAAQRGVPEPEPITSGVAPPPGPYAPGFDALHYDIRLALSDTGSYIEGEMHGRFEVTAPRPDTLALDLSGLAVNRVSAGASPVAFRYRDGKLRIPVPAGIETSDTLDVVVAYSGHPDDGLIIGRNLHGKPTVFADNWPNRARYWFPSIDHPSDKATVRFRVRLEPGSKRRVISNGILAPSGAESVWEWSVEPPIPTYTMVVGVAEFEIEKLGSACHNGACTEVSTWLFPEDVARGSVSFRRAVEMVEFYSELIAPFPYAKLAHVQSSTRFGGMENVSAVFYPEEPLSAGQNIEGTVAHETAHQWFGDAVTESDWHHLWLSEGFAEYFEALFFEHADGREALNALMETNRQIYVESGHGREPIVDPDQQDLFGLLNTNNYQKGAWILHMLRNEIGDDAFFEGIRSYYNNFKHGTALTTDLRGEFESSSGRDLEAFFDQWVFRPGHPQLAFEWDYDEGTATLSVQQRQPDAWPVFHFPLEFAFETSDGTVRHEVVVDDRAKSFEVELTGSPSELKIDPNGKLLKEVVTVSRRVR